MEQNILTRDGFQTGMSIEVLSDAGKPLFVGRIKALETGFVTLVDANNAPLPPAADSSASVQLRSQMPNSRMALYRGNRCIGTRFFWKIDQLEGGPVQNRREFYRQPVSVEGFAMLFSRGDGTEDVSEEPAMCTILDISGGGLRMRCEKVFQVGDHLLVMEVLLQEGQEPFNFGCEVRRVEENSGIHVYGCQLEGLSEDEQARLVNTIHLLQRKTLN